jgi:hypothetical protein
LKEEVKEEKQYLDTNASNSYNSFSDKLLVEQQRSIEGNEPEESKSNKPAPGIDASLMVLNYSENTNSNLWSLEFRSDGASIFPPKTKTMAAILRKQYLLMSTVFLSFFLLFLFCLFVNFSFFSLIFNL